jgi:hypothetical protein
MKHWTGFCWFVLLAINVFFGEKSLAQVAFSSSNLPIVVINTDGQDIVDDPKITVDMGIIFNGPGVRNNLTDPFNDYNGKIGIEVRGSSSQSFPKKQFGFELLDDAGESVDASLLGLPAKDDWILFAPYNDKSLMRDVLAYRLAQDLDGYASRFKYCELVLNGQYHGIYVLLEKIKRDKNRVNIDKLDPAEVSGENLTGGYIFKIDKSTGSGGDGWTSDHEPPRRSGNQTVFFQYEYPKQEDIAPEQEQYIQNYVASFENALKGETFMDPVNGYAKYINVSSFVDYFIANEVSKNPDAYRLSTFMHKKKDGSGGKLYMGPVWDFNLGFGNVNYCTGESPEGFVIRFNSICPEDFWLIPFWWDRLFVDPAFQTATAARWNQLRSGPYQTAKVTAIIDSIASVLNAESQQRNFQRWPVLGQYVWPNAFIGQTYQQEVDWLKTWVTDRLAWMDANINVVTGIESDDKSPAVQVTPNPFTEVLNISFELSESGFPSIQVVDVVGRQLERINTGYLQPGKQVLSVNTQTWPSGIYVVKITNGNTVQSVRVVHR